MAKQASKKPVVCIYCGSSNVKIEMDNDQLTRHSGRHPGREFIAYKCQKCHADFSVAKL